MISISDASNILGVTTRTLKRWEKTDKLKVYRTLGKHRRYKMSDIENFLENSSKNKEEKINVFVYDRVSTKKQKESGNLDRQKERLIEHCKEKNYNIIEVYEEIESGLNDKRRELTKMFRRLDEINKIIIEYPDRLARFGYTYLEEFAKYENVEIEITEQKDKKDANEEMVQDLIEIVTCFSTILYGARGGRKIKKTLEELEKEKESERTNENDN